MTTPAHSVEALRSIHTKEIIKRPTNWYAAYAEALTALSTSLKSYVEELSDRLDQAYNEDCRRGGWYPVPLEQQLLGTHPSRALQVNYDRIKASIESLPAVGKLREAAALSGARFTLSVRPNGISITCNFLQSTGDVIIQFT